MIITPIFWNKIKKDLKNKKTVLVGGCFDVLHPGHIIFLEKAKKVGDILVVFLESDRKTKQLKGLGRPIHNQKMRAKVLSALRPVDYIIMLPFIKVNSHYDDLVFKIKPDFIVATQGDTNNSHFQRSAKIAGSKIKYIKKIGNYSTTAILAKAK